MVCRCACEVVLMFSQYPITCFRELVCELSDFSAAEVVLNRYLLCAPVSHESFLNHADLFAIACSYACT